MRSPAPAHHGRVQHSPAAGATGRHADAAEGSPGACGGLPMLLLLRGDSALHVCAAPQTGDGTPRAVCLHARRCQRRTGPPPTPLGWFQPRSRMLAGGVEGVPGLFDGFSLVVLELESLQLQLASLLVASKKQQQDELFCFLEFSQQEYAKC